MGINLGKGTYLIANPDGMDQNFTKTVVLICDHHNDRGTFGLIVNRELDITVSEALPEHPNTADPAKKVFFGGPVETSKLFCLHAEHKKKAHSCEKICDGVYLVSNQGCMDDLMANHNANMPFRLYMGCASWAPGQLEDELKMKFWTVGDANANIVFYQKPEILWWYILRFVSAYDPESPTGLSHPTLN